MNKQFKVNHQNGVNWNVQPVKKRCSNFNDLECIDVIDKRKCLFYQDGEKYCPYMQIDPAGGKAETVVMVKISKPEQWKGGGTVILRPGQPCDHPGCCSHISHPCEGCGRTGCC